MSVEDAPLDLDEILLQLNHSAGFAYRKVREDHPKIDKHVWDTNALLSKDAGLHKPLLRIWRILAEIALVDNLAREDPTFRAEIEQRQVSMHRHAERAIKQIAAYADAHPEAGIDVGEFTRDWSTFNGTVIGVRVPPMVQQRVEDAMEHALNPISALFSKINWAPWRH